MNNYNIKSILIYFLAFILLAAVIFSLNISRGYLVYNLTLSFLPLIITEILNSIKKGKFIKILLFLMALILYPNAIYMFTDFIHIDSTDYYTIETTGNAIYNMSIIPWITLGCDVMAIFLSLVLSYETFENFNNFLNIKSIFIKIIFLIPLSIITGAAVYIGRFIRLNSWDIFLNTRAVLETIKAFALPQNYMLVFIFAAVHFLIITMFMILNRR